MNTIGPVLISLLAAEFSFLLTVRIVFSDEIRMTVVTAQAILYHSALIFATSIFFEEVDFLCGMISYFVYLLLRKKLFPLQYDWLLIAALVMKSTSKKDRINREKAGATHTLLGCIRAYKKQLKNVQAISRSTNKNHDSLEALVMVAQSMCSHDAVQRNGIANIVREKITILRPDAFSRSI